MSHSEAENAPQEVEEVQEQAEEQAQEEHSKGAKKRPRRAPRVTLALGMQYINEPTYWNWEDDELKALDGTAEDILGVIAARFEAQEPGLLVEAHGIIHDKDTLRRYDRSKLEYIEELKPRHFHFILQFARQVPLKAVAALVGVEEQFIEKPKSGPHTKPNGLAYLIHAKDSDKFQYEPEEVASYGATDYLEYYSLHKEAWEQGQDAKTVKNDNELKDWLHLRLLDGRIRREELLEKEQWTRVYSKNSSLFDTAVNIYISSRMHKAAKKLKNGEFGTSFIYVQGPSGIGKTFFVKALIEELIAEAAHRGERWDWYSAASRNALDNYAGQEIIWLDEVRPDTMGAEEWLRLLDPYNPNTAAARYHNKENMAPRYVVMSVWQDVADFFGYYSTARDIGGGHTSVAEAMDQFIRRVAVNIRLYRVVGGVGQESIAYEVRQPVQTAHGYEMRVTYHSLTSRGAMKALRHETRALSMKDMTREGEVIDGELALEEGDTLDEGSAVEDITPADDLFPFVHLRGNYLQGAPTARELELLHLVTEHVRLGSGAGAGGHIQPHTRLVLEASRIDMRLAMAVLDNAYDVLGCRDLCGVEPYRPMDWEAFHRRHRLPYDPVPSDAVVGHAYPRIDFMTPVGVDAYFSEERERQEIMKRATGAYFSEPVYPKSERASRILYGHGLYVLRPEEEPEEEPHEG